MMTFSHLFLSFCLFFVKDAFIVDVKGSRDGSAKRTFALVEELKRLWGNLKTMGNEENNGEAYKISKLRFEVQKIFTSFTNHYKTCKNCKLVITFNIVKNSKKILFSSVLWLKFVNKKTPRWNHISVPPPISMNFHTALNAFWVNYSAFINMHKVPLAKQSQFN